MGRSPSFMGSFLTLMGRFPSARPLDGPSSLLQIPLEKSPLRKAHKEVLESEMWGLSLRGVAFMTVLAGFAGFGEHLTPLLLVLQNTAQ